MKKLTTTERTETLESLRRDLPQGAILLAVTRSVAKSGMSRVIDFYSVETIDGRQNARFLSSRIGKLTGNAYNPDKQGITFKGCGYNPVAELAMELGTALYGDRNALNYETL